ncbi:MAG: DUF3244 domain-containing protein [Bacteroidales bacterium]|nr:DUF3244 domain-containing protein [Bacteroidales bacterium]
MRRFYLSLVVSLFAAIVLIANESSESSGNITQIPLLPTETENSPNLPRTLVQDIEAYHTNTMVYLTFNENLGQANIVITNANTGAQVETSVPTNCSNVQVDISSLGQGDFEIVINTAEGIYTGAFCL